ncbi:MAG: hypothetical protein ACLR2G_10820 [Phascolarctobacterium faecium]
MSLSTKEFIRETYKSIKRNGDEPCFGVYCGTFIACLGMFLLIFINANNLAQYLEVVNYCLYGRFC